MCHPECIPCHGPDGSMRDERICGCRRPFHMHEHTASLVRNMGRRLEAERTPFDEGPCLLFASAVDPPETLPRKVSREPSP